MHFIKDHQFIFVIRKILLGVGKPRTVRLRFKVEVERGTLRAYFQGQRRFSYLPWPKESYGGVVIKQVNQTIFQAPIDHPCNYGVTIQICKDFVRRVMPWDKPKSLSNDEVSASASPIRVNAVALLRYKLPFGSKARSSHAAHTHRHRRV